MAYATGTATDLNDLLDKLRIFVAANGWTVDEFINSSGGGKLLAITKGSDHFQLVSDLTTNTTADPKDTLKVYNSTAYTNGVAVGSQTNSRQAITSNKMVGPFVAYYFFLDASPDYVHVVVEIASGVYRHIHIGTLSKAFTFTGGQYIIGTRSNFTTFSGSTKQAQVAGHIGNTWPWDNGSSASNPTNQVRADLDGASNKWWVLQYSASTDRCAGMYRQNAAPTLLESLLKAGPSSFNGKATLFPITPMATRASGFVPLGYVKDVRLCNIRNIAPGSTITIGSDDWMIFPVAMKYPSTDPGTMDSADLATYSENSWVWGLAYKKVP